MKFPPLLEWAIRGQKGPDSRTRKTWLTTALICGHFSTAPLLAATITWNGSGGDDNWSTAGNWTGATAANNDHLVFSGAARLLNGNNVLTSVGTVNFTTGGFTISGNALILNGDITNAGNNTWAINSTLASARTIISSSGVLTFSGSITNGSNLLTITGAGNTVISGVLGGGSGGILKTGSGSLTLSNTNTFTGSTKISDGTLAISADANLGAAPLAATPGSIVIDGGILSTTGSFVLNSNRGITIGPASGQGNGTINVVSGELTYNGIIASNTGSGTGNLVKTGTGTFTLGGSNTYTGNTVVSAGTLKIASASAIPSGLSKGDLVLNSTLDLNNNNVTVNGFSGGGSVTNSLSGFVSFSVGSNNKGGIYNGLIQDGSGTLGFTKTGTGTITLGGNNTFTGGVVINGGTLQLANSGAINNSTPNTLTFGPNAAVGTRLQLNGNGATIGGLATNAAPGTVIIENASATAATLTVNQSSTTTFAGVLQNGTGGGALSLAKSGTGTLTLSGTNTYSGSTTINAGTLQAGSATSIPSGTGTGNVILNGGAAAGILDINGFDLAINGLSGSTGAILGKIVNNRTGTTKTITIGSGDATTTFAGLITNNTGTGGTLNLTKTGTGTLTLSNANSYSGGTSIRNGTLTSGVANALPASTSLGLGDGSTNSSGVFKLNGFTQTLSGLTNAGSGTGNRVVNGSATAVALTLSLTADSIFGGILGGSGTNENNFSLVKTGTGTLTLSGINTYAGTTSISQGILSTASLANALGTASSAVVLGDVTNTGTLSFTGSGSTFSRGFTVSAGGGQIDTTTAGQTLTIGTGNIATSGAFTLGGAGNTSITSNITGTGSLNKTGSGTLTLSGSNTYSGVTNIRNGTVTLGINNTALNAATTLTLGDATANTNGVLKLDGYSQTLASLLKTGNGTGNRVAGGNSILSNLTLNNAGNITFSGILGGTGTNENNLALTKTASGILTLSGTNTYTGGTTISAGTIAISAANNLGSTSGTLNLGAGILQVTTTLSSSRTINLTDAASTVSINSGITFTDSGVITGTGTLNLTGTGTLLLSGTSNTYAGGTKIQNGNLTLGAANALPTTTALTLGNLTTSGKLTLNGFGQTISSLTTSGTGNANSIVNGKLTAVTFTIDNASNTTFNGILGGTGTNENTFALGKTGVGTLTLGGVNTYAGDTTVSAGTLQLGVATALPSGAGKGNVVLNSGGTLDLNNKSATINGLSGTGTITSSVAGSITLTAGSNDQTSIFGGIIQNGSGTVALTKTGTGTLTLTNANTYSGNTTVTLGTLKIGNAAAVPSGSGKGNVSLTGSLDLNGNSITFNGLAGTGGISSSATGTLTLTAGANDQTSSYSGIISNGTATSIALTKLGTGVLTVSGASTYTGDTTISAGTLKLGGNNALPSGAGKGNLIISSAGTLDLNNRTSGNATLNGLSGTGIVTNTNSAGPGILSVGNNNVTSTFNGNLQDGAGLVGLLKTGTGTLTLAPTTGNNSFTGGVTISGGVLQAGNANALNSAGTNTVTFSSSVVAGTKLQLNGNSFTIAGLASGTTTGSPVVENANAAAGTLTIRNSAAFTYAGVIQDGTGGGALALVKDGAGVQTLTGTNLYTGGTTITSGILSINKDSALGATSGQLSIGNGKLQVTATIASSPRNIAVTDTASTILVDPTFTYTTAGIISGSGVLNKEGKGILQLTGIANTYSGGTVVSAGLLDVTTTALVTPLGSGNISVNAGGNLSLSSINNKLAQTITVSSNSGAKGGIGFSNALLSQAILVGMFTDNTGSDGGVLSINNGINYSSALNLSTLGGGNWFLGSAATGTFSGAAANLTVGAGSLYRLGGGGGSLTLSATNVLTGSNSVQIGFGATNGDGTVTLGGAQNYTGNTSIFGGILSIGADNRLGTVPGTTTAGNLVINGGTLSTSASFTLDSKRGIALGPASGNGTGTISVASATTLSYSGIIANNGGTGSLTKTGAGTLALGGNQNTFTGSVNLNGGTTGFTGINDLGAGTAITFNGGILQYSAGNIADITTRSVTTTAAGGATIDTNGNNVAFSGSAISGTGTFTKFGTGTLTLNIANTYAGNTTVSAGIVKLGVIDALPSGTGKGTATVTGTLDLNNFSPTLNSLAGAGIITNSLTGATTLTVDTTTASSTFSGALNNGSGTTGLVKTGANTLTLTGSTSTYSGGTTISVGTLAISNDLALGTVPSSTTTGSIVITGGAVLSATTGFTLDSKRGITIGPTGSTAASITTANATTFSYNGIIANSGTATGGLTKTSSTGVLVLGGVNTYAGDTTISGGSLKIGNIGAIPSGVGKGNVSIASANAGNLDLNGNFITINGLTGAGSVTTTLVGAAGITIGDNNQTSSFTGNISDGSGTVSIGKTGAGTLTLSGTSTYTGGTTVSGGAISIGADSNLGTAPGSATSGNLVLNGGTLVTSATLTLNANRGITVGPSSGSGSGTLAPAAGTTLTYNGIIANNGAGSGALAKTNTTGTLVLGGTNTYSGDTTVSGGTLQLGIASAIPSGTGKGNLVLAAGSTLDLNNLSPAVNALSGGGTITNSLTGSVIFTTGGNNATGTFGGIIQDGNGTVALTKTGTGTLILAGLNTYSGNTTISSGVLQLGIASALPSGPGKGNVTLNGTLDLNGFSTTVNGLSGGGTVTNTSGVAATLTAGATDQTGTFSGNIQNGSGPVALTKTGTGTLTLSGNNTYSGATTISTGTISVGSTTALSGGSTVTIASSGFLDVNGYNVTIDGLLGTGTINNNGTSPSILNAGSGGTSTQFDGVIADGTNTIALTKSGAGTLTLTGVNTYSGATTINNGTVSVANPGAGGNLGTSATAIILGDAVNKGTLSYTGSADLNFTRGFTVNNGGGQMNITTAGKTLTLQTGGIATSGTFTVGGAGNALISSVISGGGGFTKANTGSMVLSSVNTYTGDTTISTGTLQVTNIAAIPSGTGKGNVIVNGVLDVNNLNLTLNGISGGGTITNSQGSPVILSAGDNDASGNFTGVLQDGAGTLSLTKIGTGTLTLGGANTYSGNTAISSGTLKVGNVAAIASGPYKGNVSLAAAGTLDLNDYDMTINGLSGAGLVTNNAGTSILSLGAYDQTSVFTGNIRDGLGTIGFTKTGTGSLTLSGNNTFTGATSILGGTVTLGSDTALSPGSTLNLGNAGTLDLNGRVIAIDGLVGTGFLTNNGATDVILTTGASGGSGTFGGTINDGTARIALNKTGSGTVTLTSSNSYSGGTVITGGTLAITSDAVLGVVPSTATSGNITLNGGSLSALNTFALDSRRGIAIGPDTGTGSGTLDVSLNQTLTYGGIVTNNGGGSGSLIKSGSGTLTLTNANTYTGDTTISAGTLQVGNAAAIPSGTGRGNVAINGVLDLNNFNVSINGLTGTGTVSNTKTGTVNLTAGGNNQTSTFSGTLQNGNGTVALTKTGAGTLTLSGANTYTGGTTNSQGILALASPGALGSSGTISMNGGTLQFSSSNTVDYSSRIVLEDGKTATFDTNGQNVTFGSTLSPGALGTASLVKEGTGTLTITGNNTYTGATTVSSGTLFVNGTIGNTAVTVAPGATLGGAGNIGGNVTVTGTLAPGEDGQIGNLGLNSLDLVNSMLIQWDGASNFIDHVDVTNLLSLQSGSSLTFSSLGGTLTQPAYVFATYGSLGNTNNVFGTINNIPANYHVEYNYGPGMNQIALVIPEPRTALLGLIGSLCLAGRRKRTTTGCPD